MIDYTRPDPPSTSDFPHADPVQVEPLVRDYLRFVGEDEIEELTVACRANFVLVYYFKTPCERPEGGKIGGWVVAGELPYLRFSDWEITTPLEALALYSWFLYLWVREKGQADDEHVPIFRCAPDWHPLSYPDEYQAMRLTAKTTFLNWHLINEHPEDLHHPEIRDRCRRAGWFPHDAP